MYELDLIGLNCPLPVLKTKKLLADITSGTRIRVLTSDPASAIDLRDFCNKTGHLLIEQNSQDNLISTIIEHR